MNTGRCDYCHAIGWHEDNCQTLAAVAMSSETQTPSRGTNALVGAGELLYERVEHIGCRNCGIKREGTSDGAQCVACKEAIAAWDAAIAIAATPSPDVRDAERIDFLERCIRDGSYLSVFNDIIATCQAAYQSFGRGPALRTAIDANIPDRAIDTAIAKENL